MKVITNHQWRDHVHGWELTEAERKEVDYIEDIDEQVGRFFRYRGQLYDLQEFQRIPRDQPWVDDPLKEWHGYVSDTYFSGILVKYDPENDRIMVGTYIS